MLFQHFFWFYSHPAVYIMIVPGMGVISELISTFARKPIFGYRFVAYSSLSLALLSFLVWGHHMFVSGQSRLANMVFSALTFTVGIPSAIKVFNWVATLYKGDIRLKTADAVRAVVPVAVHDRRPDRPVPRHPVVDVHLHDTYFVVAHFHYVMMGSTLVAFLGGLHYWWPKFTGKMYNESLGRMCAIGVFFGFNLTFLPQFVMGARGMPRRYWDYDPQYQIFHQLSTIGAFMLGISLFITVCYLFGVVLKNGKKAPRNPWGGSSLEWQAPTPPTLYNFEKPPILHELYNYDDLVEVAEDVWERTSHRGGAGGGRSHRRDARPEAAAEGRRSGRRHGGARRVEGGRHARAPRAGGERRAPRDQGGGEARRRRDHQGCRGQREGCLEGRQPRQRAREGRRARREGRDARHERIARRRSRRRRRPRPRRRSRRSRSRPRSRRPRRWPSKRSRSRSTTSMTEGRRQVSAASHDAHGDDHGHGHGHSRFIQHHYDDAQHQFDAGKFGIWLFLAQEVLFFSALFVAYVLYRVHHPEIYSYAHKWLDVKFGAINTAVLIFSSLTAAWAVRAAQLNQRELLIGCLAIDDPVRVRVPRHQVHRVLAQGSRAHPVRPLLRPVRELGRRGAADQEQRVPGVEDHVVWRPTARTSRRRLLPGLHARSGPEEGRRPGRLQGPRGVRSRSPRPSRRTARSPARRAPARSPRSAPRRLRRGGRRDRSSRPARRTARSRVEKHPC